MNPQGWPPPAYDPVSPPVASKSNKWVGLALLLASVPFDAWAMWKLWVWFLVPLGVRQVGIAHVYGVALLLSLMRWRPTIAIAIADDEWVKRAGETWGAAAVYLGIGYLVRLLVIR